MRVLRIVDAAATVGMRLRGPPAALAVDVFIVKLPVELAPLLERNGADALFDTAAPPRVVDDDTDDTDDNGDDADAGNGRRAPSAALRFNGLVSDIMFSMERRLRVMMLFLMKSCTTAPRVRWPTVLAVDAAATVLLAKR